MHKNYKYEEMLMQIRQIIHQQIHKSKLTYFHQTHRQGLSQIQNQALNTSISSKNSNIDSLIEQSSRILMQNKGKSKNNLVNSNKILAANQLLKQQIQPFIKSYIKEKIQSQIFAVQRNNFLSKQQLHKFEQQKQILIRLRQQQIQDQKQRRAKLVKNVKQFDENKNSRISIHQINSIIYKEQPSSAYLLSISPSNNKNKIISKSNEVKNSNLFISQVYSQQKQIIKSSNKILSSKSQIQIKRQNQQNQYDQSYKQIQQEVEDYKKYQNQQVLNSQLKQKLLKYPHIAKILMVFLEKQYKIMSLQNSSININTSKLDISRQNNSKNSQQEQQVYVWKNKPKKYSQKLINSKNQDTNISGIIQKFKFKAFLINEQNRLSNDKDMIIQKRINKKIGDTKNYHLKRCALTKNELIYYDENEKKEMKKIQLPLQKIQIQKDTKQQGSFFSKKQLNIQIVSLKGKNRNFKFQKGNLQGEDLYNQLVKLMSNKVHGALSKINGSTKIYLNNFIHNPQFKILDFSDKLFEPIQNQTEQKQKFLSILCDLITLRPDIQNLQLQKNKLNPNQINFILQKCLKLNSLKIINLSTTRIGKITFIQLCKLVNEIKNKELFEIRLNDCKLDDDIFLSNVGIFTSFCSKVKYLNLSKNNLTSKAIQILKNCLQNVTSQVKYLFINDCPIKQLGKLSNMIKDAKKLEYLQAQNCSLAFQKKSITQLQTLFQCFKKQSNLKSLKLSRNGCLSSQGIKILSRSWMSESFKILQIDIDYSNNSKNIKTLDIQDNNSIQLNFQLIQKIKQN